MATAQSKLDILIEAKNNASSTFNQVKSDAGGLEETLMNVGKGLLAAFSVEALKNAAETGFEMARESAQAERLGASFDTLATKAGQSSQDMLSSMEDASRGTISDVTLMGDANKAMLLGVATTGEKMSQLLEVAAARGKAMGETTAAAYGDIITGIGRLSPRILDNLGIIVDQEAANKAYAASVGKVADKLTEQEQKQALVNAVIRSSTDLVNANKAAGGDAADNFERMDASIENAKDALGELFSPAATVIAQSIADAARSATGAMKEMAAPVRDTSEATATLNLTIETLNEQIANEKDLMKQLDAAGQGNSDTYQELAAEVGNLTGQLVAAQAGYNAESIAAGTADEQTRGMTATLSMSTEAQTALAAAAYATARSLQEESLQASLAQQTFNALIATQTQGSAAIAQAAAGAGALFAGKVGGDAGLAKQKEVTDELSAQRREWREMGYTEDQITNVLLPGMISQINSADSAMFSTATHTEKLSDAAKAAKEQFDNLKGVAASVLSSALNTGTGVDPQAVLEKMGIPRADVVNENARRLADIAQNGLKGQNWLGDFQSQVPDIWKMIRLAQNPQEEAAHLLQDFQDGLLTSPIDKAKAKEIIKRQIMGDANMSAMAQEIATEISQEMGIPLQEALAKTKGVLGGGGAGTTAGTDTATAFSDGANTQLDASDTGGGLVDKVISQINANMAKLGSAGKAAAKVWGDAFIGTVGDNVPPALISILVNLTTPGVMAQLAKNATLTGANP